MRKEAVQNERDRVRRTAYDDITQNEMLAMPILLNAEIAARQVVLKIIYNYFDLFTTSHWKLETSVGRAL